MKKMKLFALAFAAMFGMSATAETYKFVTDDVVANNFTAASNKEDVTLTSNDKTCGETMPALNITMPTKGTEYSLTTKDSFNEISAITINLGSSDRGKTYFGIQICAKADFSEGVTTIEDITNTITATLKAKTGAEGGNKKLYELTYNLEKAANGYVRFICQSASGSSNKSVYYGDIEIKGSKGIPTTPTLLSYKINNVLATIDESTKTISAEFPYGTTLDYDNAVVTTGGTATGWSYNAEKTKLTVTDGTNNLEFTLNITVAGPSTESDLLEVVMSNGTKAFIVNHDSVLTATAVYMKGESVPTVSKTTVSENANAAVEGNVITVTAQDGTTKTPFTLKVVEYEPLATFTSGTAIVFDTTIVTNPNTYLASVYGWDSSKGIKWAKPQNDASNMRIQEGKNRIYLFLPACDSVMFVGGSGGARDVEVTLNGAVYADVKKTPAKDATITIKLNSTTNNLLGFESNGSANGDSGFTSMTLYKGGQPTGIDAIEVLDMNAPMFNLMGQQVTADYKGIVIQNGAKYLLK